MDNLDSRRAFNLLCIIFKPVEALNRVVKRKKGKKRRSVLKRLHEKQMEVDRREKRVPQQELPKDLQEQEIERKPNK